MPGSGLCIYHRETVADLVIYCALGAVCSYLEVCFNVEISIEPAWGEASARQRW